MSNRGKAWIMSIFKRKEKEIYIDLTPGLTGTFEPKTSPKKVEQPEPVAKQEPKMYRFHEYSSNQDYAYEVGNVDYYNNIYGGYGQPIHFILKPMGEDTRHGTLSFKIVGQYADDANNAGKVTSRMESITDYDEASNTRYINYAFQAIMDELEARTLRNINR